MFLVVEKATFRVHAKPFRVSIVLVDFFVDGFDESLVFCEEIFLLIEFSFRMCVIQSTR